MQIRHTRRCSLAYYMSKSWLIINEHRRICVKHLQAAAEELSGKASSLQNQLPTQATGMDMSDGVQSQQQLSAQRAARCMQLLLEMITCCRVYPSLLPIACQNIVFVCTVESYARMHRCHTVLMATVLSSVLAFHTTPVCTLFWICG